MMKIPTLLLRGFVLCPLLFVAQTLRAQGDACALLKPADLTTLLGASPVAKSNVTSCRWTASGSSKKLIVAIIRMRSPRVTPEMAFAGARMGASKGGTVTVTDEAGIGDKAFSSLESFGVVLMSIKNGRMLQLQYWTDTPGTAKDVASLRTVAKKVIAAFP